jgi:hypothetical protein
MLLARWPTSSCNASRVGREKPFVPPSPGGGDGLGRRRLSPRAAGERRLKETTSRPFLPDVVRNLLIENLPATFPALLAACLIHPEPATPRENEEKVPTPARTDHRQAGLPAEPGPFPVVIIPDASGLPGFLRAEVSFCLPSGMAAGSATIPARGPFLAGGGTLLLVLASDSVRGGPPVVAD